MLSDMEYHVMRKEGTERALPHLGIKNYADGMYHCRDALPLYSSEHKYNSGTGWPSFWQAQKMLPLPGKEIANFSWSEQNATAAAADHIWDMYSMTAPNYGQTPLHQWRQPVFKAA